MEYIIATLQQIQGNLFMWGLTLIVGFAMGITLQSRKDIDFLDLVCTNGKLDHKKFWENVALAVGVWAFVYSVYMNYVNDLIWLIFLGTYTSNQLVKRALELRYGQGTPAATDSEKEKENG